MSLKYEGLMRFELARAVMTTASINIAKTGKRTFVEATLAHF